MFEVLGVITFCYIIIVILSIMLAIIVEALNYVITYFENKLTKKDEDDII